MSTLDVIVFLWPFELIALAEFIRWHMEKSERMAAEKRAGFRLVPGGRQD